MKVLLFDTTNAFLTPGGKTTHAIKLHQEISNLGVDIQYARWWDRSQQEADIIHFLGYTTNMPKIAKQQGIKCFLSQIFDFESNKTNNQKRFAIIKNKCMDLFPKLFDHKRYWDAYKYIDCIQFMHKYDRDNALKYFPRYLQQDKTIIIPHAFDPNTIGISSHLNIQELKFPDKYLVSCANISQRKQTVMLAKYAKIAKVPIVFLGSHCDSDSYYQAFQKEIDNKYVFYPGYVSDEWKDCIENNASGYVLLSKGESGCIAVYEAAAYKMPLLLSNLPWAWGYENPTDIYFCDYIYPEKAINQLKEFFDKSGKIDHHPFTIHTWADIAKIYIDAYTKILR